MYHNEKNEEINVIKFISKLLPDIAFFHDKKINLRELNLALRSNKIKYDKVSFPNDQENVSIYFKRNNGDINGKNIFIVNGDKDENSFYSEIKSNVKGLRNIKIFAVCLKNIRDCPSENTDDKENKLYSNDLCKRYILISCYLNYSYIKKENYESVKNEIQNEIQKK